MDEISKFYEPIKQAQEANNAWSAEQAQKAMDYQTQMSNTAHQREVADLKAAGLNPVLSAGGAGASTTSGVAASAGQENITAMFGLMAKAFQAQIDQAKAMENTAKVVSGSSASSNPSSGTSSNSDDSLFEDSGLKGLIQDVLKRKLGISYDTSDKILNTAETYKKVWTGEMSLDDAGSVGDAIGESNKKTGELLKKWMKADSNRNAAKSSSEASNVLASALDSVKNLFSKASNVGAGSTYHSGNRSSGRGGSFSSSSGKFKSGSIRKNYKYSV